MNEIEGYEGQIRNAKKDMGKYSEKLREKDQSIQELKMRSMDRAHIEPVAVKKGNMTRY